MHSMAKLSRMIVVAAGVGASLPALAQTPAPPEPPAAATVAPAPALPPPAPVPATIDQLGWLQGCWEGKVNQRDFREEWLPLRGEMMIGASQTVLQGKTQDFEYLRLEVRPDGVYYVAIPSGKKEEAFRLKGKLVDGDDEIFGFENPSGEFPQHILYRHGTGGWLYVHVEGTINGQERKVIYPMRRVDCKSGEMIIN
jgi:Domain of unknown function (DUF6265)